MKVLYVCVFGLIFATAVNACLRKVPQTSFASDAITPVDLMYLANFEKKVYQYFIDSTNELQPQDQNGTIQKYIQDYAESTLAGTSSLPVDTDEWVWATVVASHPIMSYRMIRRMVVDLSKIISMLEEQGQNDFLTNFYNARSNLKWPTLKDNEDMMTRIIRIQVIYDMKVQEFANGEIKVANEEAQIEDDEETEVLTAKLNALHCMEIGAQAFGIGKLASAVEWMNVAFRMVYRKDRSLSAHQAAPELAYAVLQHDKALDHVRFGRGDPTKLNRLWSLDLFRDKVENAGGFTNSRLRHLRQNPKDKLFRVLQLCGGTTYQNESTQARLSCSYQTKGHAYSILAPMKVEVLSRKPSLFKVHDFLSSKGTLDLMDETIRLLNEMTRPEPTNIPAAKIRRDFPFVLMDDRLSSSVEVSHKLDCFTGNHGHNKSSAERLQVSGFTFGNSDLRLEAPSQGIDIDDSVAREFTSAIIFLNDVDKGGYTVFPGVGIHVKPEKGSALLWSNKVRPAGKKIDTGLVYSECPVIVGKKWLAKKKVDGKLIL